MANLVIVESPAKASTIKGYLGTNYKVIASKGHIRDLPKSSLGIDIENDFAPHYINIRGKGDVIKELKKEAKNANKIFLATDPDREGEAISWHIANELGIPQDRACRVTFNEITQTAVKEAIKNPRQINLDLVNSQQARRILDRLVGFKLSEVLWKNVKSGLSGGRVQYWTIEASLSTSDGEKVDAKFFGDKNGKIKLASENDVFGIKDSVKADAYYVKDVKHAVKYKQPAPPFTTSTLQQEASRQLGYQSQRIMKVAQEHYDGLNLGTQMGGVQGLITYMRTDSTRVSAVAQESCAAFIKEKYGDEYLPQTARSYKTNAAAQDAHEAIRPSNVYFTPKSIRKMLTNEQYKLYKLIWERFIASQMASAVLDTVSVEIENGGYIFKTGGYVIKSKGYLTLYDYVSDDIKDPETEEFNLASLPNVKKGEVLKAESVEANQHFTEPPARYTEASLIKFLEENGIGRPSTYAPIISIIISREYVKRDGKTLVATPLGEITTKFMREYFPEIIDYEFTATMEDKLDSIERNENSINGVIKEFYGRFEEELKAVSKYGKKLEVEIPQEESDVLCDRCGSKMIYKNGRFGKFLACPNYPKCKCTRAIDKNGNVVDQETVAPELAGFKCEVCGGDMVVRSGRFGSFYACINYPECTFTKQKVTDTGASCPICSSRILARHGKGRTLFYSCEKYPECDFSSWDMPLVEKCPDCGSTLFYRKSRKNVICKEKNCGYKREEEMAVIE